MSRIDVSVVVPTFDGAAYLDACLASVAEQDLRDVEVLVSDDGSSDDTVAIARSFVDVIPGLRIEQNAQRLGPVGNVNRCLRLARGAWVKPVFQDDLLRPGALDALRQARQPGVPVVIGDREYHFEQGVRGWQRRACVSLLSAGIARRFPTGVVGVDEVADLAATTVADRRPQLNFVGEPIAILLDRRAALHASGFDAGYAQLWDYELVVRMGMRRGLAVVADPVATFRVHSESETARNLAESSFATNVVDRLRLLVAYATGRAYTPVRLAAGRLDPPVDLTAMAMGSAWAARLVADRLPPSERELAHTVLDRLAHQLPMWLDPPWAGGYAASRYAVELLHELTSDTDEAVAELYRNEELAVDLATGRPAGSPEAPARPDPGPHDEVAAPATSADQDTARRRGRRRPLATLRAAVSSLRANEWWGHMLGPLVANAYLQIGWRDVDTGTALGRVVALIACTAALAPYGYVVNDASDVEVDRRAGKRNSMAGLPPLARLGVIAAFALAGAVPWFFVHLDPPAIAALAGVYLLPLVYSPRPLRLKEHRVLGPLADAANAFLLPGLFSVALFAPLGAAAGPPPLMVAGVAAWATGFGLRAILLHQIQDASNDRASRTRTFVTTYGEARTARLMRRLLFPLEIAGLALLAATVAYWAPWAAAVAAIALLAFHTARVSGAIDRSLSVTQIERGWLLSWTQVWPALALSVLLAVRRPLDLVFVALVVLLFGPRLRYGLTNLRVALINERRRRRLRHHPD